MDERRGLGPIQCDMRLIHPSRDIPAYGDTCLGMVMLACTTTDPRRLISEEREVERAMVEDSRAIGVQLETSRSFLNRLGGLVGLHGETNEIGVNKTTGWVHGDQHGVR